ncbi:hypothetical protein [Paenilisteria weihenstephanensis]|uniref:hypothetical protein n=1 Tax=Listeria weihenstephanensis TaxID=1006155 RepID=UPI000E56DBD7|nr:hypothetical protein [Listeria weihenstephanensis]
MNREVIQEREYIKSGFEILYGKLGLVSMRGTKKIFSGMLVIMMFMALMPVVVPNPMQKEINDILVFLMILNIILNASILSILLIRVNYIYNTKKPWKYGLEYSIYFYLCPVMMSISAIMIATIMSITLFNSDFTGVIISVGALIFAVIVYSIHFVYRGWKGKSSQRHTPKKESLGKIQFLGIAIVVLIIVLPDVSVNRFGYAVLCILPATFALVTAGFFFDLFCLRYKKGIDFDAYYAVIDGINPDKNYPPNYGEKKKKRK